MSKSQPEQLSNEEIIELLQGEPDEVFAKHADTLRAMRTDVDSERVRRLIDYVLEKYDIEQGGAS